MTGNPHPLDPATAGEYLAGRGLSEQTLKDFAAWRKTNGR